MSRSPVLFFDGGNDQHHRAAQFVFHARYVEHGFIRPGFDESGNGETRPDQAIDVSRQGLVEFGDFRAQKAGTSLAFGKVFGRQASELACRFASVSIPVNPVQ